MTDLNCPYCDAGNTVRHDGDFGYAENVKHEMQCRSCTKNFVFETYISFNYSPHKADCLNDQAHDLQMTKTWRPGAARLQCRNCDFEAIAGVHETTPSESEHNHTSSTRE